MNGTQRRPEIEILPPLGGNRRGRQVDPVLEELSRWMDARFEIPGLGVKFGLDPLLGLLPGVGDTITTLVSFFILSAAVRQNVPRVTVARMGMNIAIDYILGAVPFVGDLFDFAWKSNEMNIALMRRSLEAPHVAGQRATWGDWLFVGGMMLGLLGLLALSLATAFFLLKWLASQLPPIFS